MERGKVSGNFELAFGDQAAVMNVEIEGMTDTCSDETQALWTLYDYDMSKIIDTLSLIHIFQWPERFYTWP